MAEDFVKHEDALKEYDVKAFRTPDGYTSDNVIFTIVKDKEAKYGRILKVMLIKRAMKNKEGKPNIEGGKWALPGGFIDPEESAYEAAKRELEEETKVKNIHIKKLDTYEKLGRDKRGWMITKAHYAVVPEYQLSKRQAGDDAQEVELFDVDEVFKLPLAFDHELIIKDALELIKLDMVETTLAKEFLPKEFTLSELRSVILSVSEEIANEVVKSEPFFWRKAPKFPFLELAKDEEGSPKTIIVERAKTRLYKYIESRPIDKSIYK
ncbi:NUDIX domain-containing protein [Niallia nealsonii]|uniref:ADP-ribose pyrophosphatase n=1 Tax=Niallia nealsonii TaxID=115979 RepID=A0A2N0YWK5_9BACI|nr:NUDIX hydrolase [Niallia nealsonii]PKG21635.1 ADP-ribose pyrophosphatase [Niallia nealsonii]